jgi:hypothetical protein
MSGLDALAGSVPSEQVFAAVQRRVLDDHRRRARDFRQTCLPPCLTLGLTLPALAGGWFLLDPLSVLRLNAVGLGIPIGLGLLGALFLGVTVLLIVQERHAQVSAQP